MNLNFSQEEITFQEEVRDFLRRELTPDLVNAAKQTSAVFTEKEVAMEWQKKLAKQGWLEDGVHREKIFDVACSDGLIVNPKTNRCPDNKAEVNLADCSFSSEEGDVELKTFWQDPEFRKDQNAFYYSRALENPTCRWSTWDAIRENETPRSDIPLTIQERAWSSPIWFQGN